jgi:hypothetical protein
MHGIDKTANAEAAAKHLPAYRHDKEASLISSAHHVCGSTTGEPAETLIFDYHA